jgi:HK97 family phage major capsid protein
MTMQPSLPDAMNEPESLRMLDWPLSRRDELRSLLPSVPSGLTRLYQRSAVERLKTMSDVERDELRKNGALFTRNGTAAAPTEIHTRTAEIFTRKIDSKARTVELSFSSEASVTRWFGDEILDHTPASVRLGRLNGGAALLLDHNPEKQIGVVVSARIDSDRKGRAVVRFGTSQLAEEVFRDVQEGIRRLVSVGYRIHAQEKVGTNAGRESVRVTDWEPYEISLVSIPADDSVGVGRAMQSAPTNSNFENQMSQQTSPIDPAAAERSRVTRINEIAADARRSGFTIDEHRAIADGLTPEQFREQFRAQSFETLLARQSSFTPGTPSNNYGGNGNARGGLDLGRYSLCRAIHSAGQGRLDGLEAEVSQELARSMGKSPDGFFVPHGILIGQRAGLSVTGDSGDYGGNTVGLMIGGFIDALRPMLAVAQAGATVMSGLTGNVGLPRHVAASTASWKGEVAELDEKSQEIDQVLLTPKRVGAWTKFSKQLVAQSSHDVENFVRMDLLAAVAVAFDLAAIAGTGADSQPTGILNTSGIGSVAGGTNGLAPTWAHLVALMSAVANANAAGARSSFLFSTKVEGKLRNTVKVASTDSKMILEDGQTSLVGKPWVASNNVPDNLTKGTSSGVCSAIIFGNFADVVLASFGAGTDVVVDPYSLATSGQVKVVVNSYCDVGIRRAASFAAMKDALTA